MRPPQFSTEKDSLASSNNGPRTTDRYIVTIEKDATEEGIKFLRDVGLTVAISNNRELDAIREDEFGEVDAIVFPNLGVALVAGKPEQVAQLQYGASDTKCPIKMIQEEKVREAIRYEPAAGLESTPPAGFSADYLHGYERAVAHMLERLQRKSNGIPSTSMDASTSPSSSQGTWGLQATNVLNSPFSGRGIRVAVLDSGIDFHTDANGEQIYHPDFKGRSIVTASFVNGVPNASDGAGHGTHCVGTACGPRNPNSLPRYGIAHEAEIYVGKVLNDQGRGVDGWILAGLEWAIQSGCQVVSMSLGSPRQPGQSFDPMFEDVASRALNAGTLIVAAAGNRSRRPLSLSPVDDPANCPSIMAVAAVDSSLQVASFSAASINPNGGEVNIAGPGVQVLSSYPVAQGRYSTEDGTSMAAPHVAGIAALYAEANPNARGKKLWDLVANSAQRMTLPSRDVGSGLVQAPTKTIESQVEEPQTEDYSALQSSPITVGGGGSVCVAFSTNRYRPNSPSAGMPTRFANEVNDFIEKLRIIDRFSYGPDRTPGDINCKIVVHTIDHDAQGNEIPNSDSPITIYGNPLSVEFRTQDYPYDVPTGGTSPVYYNSRRKIVGVVEVWEGTSTTPILYPVPTGGICLVDVLNKN